VVSLAFFVFPCDLQRFLPVGAAQSGRLLRQKMRRIWSLMLRALQNQRREQAMDQARWLPLAVLLAVMFAGCSKSAPYAQYRDAELKSGMKIADIKQQFGEPDSFVEWWNKDPDGSRFMSYSSKQSVEYPHHVEELNYEAFGAHDQKKGRITSDADRDNLANYVFGAHDQKKGHITLSITFVDGELYGWKKSTVIDME